MEKTRSLHEVPPSDGLEPGLEGEALRCPCGRLICIRYGDVIELKCAKCKRMIRIETKGIERITVR